MGFKNTFPQLLLILALLTSLIVPVTALANPAHQTPLTQYVQSSDGRVSLRLPESWTYTDVVAGENILTYGDSADAVTGRLNDVRGQTSIIVGNGGTIVLLNVADYGYTTASTEVLKSVMDSGLLGVQNVGGSVLEDPQEVEINPGQTIILAVILAGGEQGYAATIGFGDMMALMTATGTPTTWEANRDLLYSIVQSVRMPADASTAPPDENLPAEDDVTVVRATDGSLSVAIPTGWSFKDQLTDNQIFVFGETETEAENRSVFWISNEQIEVGGKGGLISSRPLAEIGLDPATVNIGNTSNTFIQNLGVTVIEVRQLFTVNNAPGAYAVVDWGQQRGYLAFIIFGETLAIVYVSDTPANFEASRDALFPILESVRIPAEIAAPPTAGTGGNTGNNGGTGDGGTGLGGVLGNTGNQDTSTVALPQALRNEPGTLEILLPEDWQTFVAPSEESIITGGDTIYFASSQAEIEVLRSSGLPTAAGGLILFFDRILIDPTKSQTPEQLLAMLDAPELGGRSETQTDTINGNQAIWFEFNQETPTSTRGYWVVFVFEDKLALMALRTPPSDWEQSGAILEAIFRSVRYNPEGLSGLGSTGGLGSLGGSATPAPLRPGGATPTPTRPPASPTPTFTPTSDAGQIQTTPGGPSPTPTLSSVG